MSLAFEMEAQIMERRHINLCHMTFISDEHLCVICHTFIPHFMENVRILKNSYKLGGRIRTHCKLLARADSVKVRGKNNGFHCFDTISNVCKH